jgi:chemotaxis protein CheY-P-specific phosphatase CheC
MLKDLNEDELRIATKLIFDGLSMAKVSMEQILQSPIIIEKIDFEHSESGAPRFTDQTTGSVHLIKTELIGELKGLSHLIFSESEVSKLYKACLPPNIINDDSPEANIMKMGFLTEIDNMVAAAVITEFSNFLGVEIYGHVPNLIVLKATEVNNFLKKEAEQYDSFVRFKATFHGSELDISPDFLWMFQNKFVEKIKTLV